MERILKDFKEHPKARPKKRKARVTNGKRICIEEIQAGAASGWEVSGRASGAVDFKARNHPLRAHAGDKFIDLTDHGFQWSARGRSQLEGHGALAINVADFIGTGDPGNGRDRAEIHDFTVRPDMKSLGEKSASIDGRSIEATDRNAERALASRSRSQSASRMAGDNPPFAGEDEQTGNVHPW